MEQKSNEYSLYIPRVSISSSSSSSKGSSRLKEFAQEKRSANGEVETSGESESEGVYGSSVRNYDGGPRTTRNQMYFVHKAPKRGSHSIESSSSSSAASNHSNYNVNSLLLSVKNLENFNRQSTEPSQITSSKRSESNPNIVFKSNYYANYFINNETTNYPIYEYRSKMLQNIRNIAPPDGKIRPFVGGTQGKETGDDISIASSNTTTNFTMVNDSHQRLKKSKGICRRSHQITILILVMSVLFIVLLSSMLVMLDKRNQKMPR